jgi:cobalt/nickel transport system permease protein
MHIHVPDGVFPIWLWLSALAAEIALLSIALFIVRKDRKKLVITSALSALLLVVFSIEFFGYHLNFTALSGMLLGPWWSLISLTIVNVFLALFGHGGVTTAPINILLNWAEALTGFAFFQIAIRRVKKTSSKAALSSAAVFTALALSFALFLLVVRISGINPGFQLESESVVPLNNFVKLSIIPTAIGALIEAALTFLVVSFIAKAKPEMLR